jgi:hypothetical protein
MVKKRQRKTRHHRGYFKRCKLLDKLRLNAKPRYLGPATRRGRVRVRVRADSDRWPCVLVTRTEKTPNPQEVPYQPSQCGHIRHCWRPFGPQLWTGWTICDLAAEGASFLRAVWTVHVIT